MFPNLLHTATSAHRPKLTNGTEYLHKPHCLDFLSRGVNSLKEEPAGALAVIDAETVGIRPVLADHPGGPVLMARRLRRRHSNRIRIPAVLAKSAAVSLS